MKTKVRKKALNTRRVIRVAVDFLLPYQKRWILDPSEKKLWVKGRQTGGTFTESLDETMIGLGIPGLDQWWISRDDKQSREFIRYVSTWVQLINAIAWRLGMKGTKLYGLKEAMRPAINETEYINYNKQVMARIVQFSNGSRICALTSNPDAARGNHGNLGIDELAAHKDQERLFRVAKPIITTGGNLKIISTHDGPGVFNDLVKECEEGDNKKGFSLHKVTIVDAVEQGYVKMVVNPVRQRLHKKPLTDDEWLQQIRDGCLDEIEWQQEYMCICVEEAYALLPIPLIATAERPDNELYHSEEFFAGSPTYMGMDIGRHRDLTVFWVATRVGDILYTREIKCLDQCDYDSQEHALNELMKRYRITHACIDETTKGQMLAERAVSRWGEMIITAVNVNQSTKGRLAPLMKAAFERRLIRIPIDQELREDLHRVEKQVGENGVIRYHAPSTRDGHSDRFFAGALMLAAAGEPESYNAARIGGREKFTDKRDQERKPKRKSSKYGGY